jgi:UDP-N-acetyl-D-mannosaminuronic acid dehydrogenase
MTKNHSKKIAVVGLGYIGLPTAAILASRGIEVIGIDISVHAVNTINQGKIHIVEPGLDKLVHDVVQKKLLYAQTIPTEADIFLIAVPTPFKSGHEPDISYVKNACRSIAAFLKPGNVVILESTSPVGTTEEISQQLAILRKDLKFPHEYPTEQDIFIAYCSERVLPGKILDELVENDRVIGGITSACANKAKDLYEIFVKGSCFITNVRTAEMCKLTENSFRDVNIAFANELSILCNGLNIDVWELINLANKHPRVNVLQPGCGVGGHCIAVDPWFIVAKDKKNSELIAMARKVNNKKPLWVVDQVKEQLNELAVKNKMSIANLKVGCFGLAFKPDIDDFRESPALVIVKELIKNEINVVVVEPNLQHSDEFDLIDIAKAIKQVDLIILLVAHKEFKNINWKNKLVLDICGITKKT